MNAVFVRHGATAGNMEKRYVGCTDEGLSEEGRAALLRCTYPAVEAVAVSPMTRCVETAYLIYPDHEPIIVPNFRECDFGEFEYKNYAELNGNPAYQAWIDSGGNLPFPGGESRDGFSKGCVSAFVELMAGLKTESLAIVVHGGTIMAILAALALPKRDYFDWRIHNGGVISMKWDGETLTSPKWEDIINRK